MGGTGTRGYHAEGTMKYRELGNTGIQVSEVGFGASTVSGRGSYGVVDKADGLAAVQRAYEVGVTFFDTAEGYSEGRSEELLGKAFEDKHDVVICTKVGGRALGPMTPERIRASAEASLRRLRRDAIDVYLLHNPTTEVIRDAAVRDALSSLQRDGLIRTYGVSCTTAVAVEQGHEVVAQGGYTSMQIPLNILQQQVVDGLLLECQRASVGVIARVPLAAGLLTGKYDANVVFPQGDHRAGGTIPADQWNWELASLASVRKLVEEEGVSWVNAALGWVLSHQAVSTVIPGAKNPAQAESNAGASDVALPASFVDGMRALPRRPGA